MTERPQPSGRPAAEPGHEPEPEETLAPDEAPTPAWLPLVGVGLAIVGLIVFAAKGSARETSGEQAQGADGAPSAEVLAPGRPSPAPPSRVIQGSRPSGRVVPPGDPARPPRRTGPAEAPPPP